MQPNEIVAAFEQARARAERLPTWVLRLRVRRLRRRLRLDRWEVDRARLTAVENVLRSRGVPPATGAHRSGGRR